MADALTFGPTVFVVDDDPSVRKSLRLMLKAAGIHVEDFQSAQDFLSHYKPDQRGVLLLDVLMPGISGLGLQKELADRGWDLPIIFISGHGTVRMAVDAVKSGAVDFVEKPFSRRALLERIREALAIDAERQRSAEIVGRIKKLTPREHQVMEMVVTGSANKVIAIDLGISEKTVENHRTQVMRKMAANSLAELVQMTFQAGVPLRRETARNSPDDGDDDCS